MTLIGVGVLWFYRRSLVPVPAPAPAADLDADRDADRDAGSAVAAGAHTDPAPLVVAVAGPSARQVSAMAVPLARARGGEVHVLHVIEVDVVAGEGAIEVERSGTAQETLQACLAELREAGVPVAGELLHSYGNHADVATQILSRAADLGAGAVVVGPDGRPGPLYSGVAAQLAARAPVHVVVLHPSADTLGSPTSSAPRVDPQARRRSVRP